MKNNLLIALLITQSPGTFCQNSKQVQLNQGDKIPEKYFQLLSPGQSKFILLDFWSFNCITCIRTMPKLDSLYKGYKGQLQVNLINKQPDKAVDSFFYQKKFYRPSLRMINGDTLFSELFPHAYFPHYVIIDSSRTIQHVTYGYNINRDIFDELMDNDKIVLEEKNELLDYNNEMPLWSEGRGRLAKHLQYYSMLMERIPGIGSYSTIDKSIQSSKLKFTNTAILDLFKIAYGKSITGEFKSNNRIIFSDSAANQLIEPARNGKFNEWKNKNIFCYELRLPTNNPEELFSAMQQDVNRLFNFHVSVEKRVQKCLAVVRTSECDKISSKGGVSKQQVTNDSIVIMNMPIQQSIIKLLNNQNSGNLLPIVNETKFTGPIDMILSSSPKNLAGIRKELQKYDLDLQERLVEINMLVISKKRDMIN